jgi:hypothetical protein
MHKHPNAMPNYMAIKIIALISIAMLHYMAVTMIIIATT